MVWSLPVQTVGEEELANEAYLTFRRTDLLFTRNLLLTGAIMSKSFNSAETAQKYGATFAGFIESVRAGFLKAYEDSKADGFDPDGPLSEESRERVLKVLQVLEDTYGSTDLKPLGPIAVVSALGLFQRLNDILHGFESYANAKPEDFAKVREILAADQRAKAQAYAPGEAN